MITEFCNDDGTTRRVWIRMTPDERARCRRAHLLSWLMFWRTPAEIMGPELESILCGWAPERYITIEDWKESTP